MRNSTTNYQLSTIVDVRIQKSEDDEEVVEEGKTIPSDTEMKVEEVMVEADVKQHKFDYYVHYLGLERRNDRWAKDHEIRVIDEDEIKSE